MASKDFTITGQKWKGYTDDPKNADAETLSTPSLNVAIDKQGVARTRPGFEATALDLAQANKAALPLHVPHFDLTFFAVGTKVYYVEGDPDTGTKIDTGITLTSGTHSRFEEHNGIVYVGNVTDGWSGILITRLNGAVTTASTAIVTDLEGAALAKVFDTELSLSTNNLRINGTNEEYDTITIATGTFDLTTTATSSGNYADNSIAIIVYGLTSKIPNCAKLIAWREHLHAIGLSENAGVITSDRRKTVMAFSNPITAAAAENAIKFTGGTSGTELIGKSGELVNGIATRDYLYLFKENAVYYIAVSDINLTTGARPPQLLKEGYGCLNPDCAADMGNGEVVFLTRNKRIIRIKISSEAGAPVVFPDESFDLAYSNTLKLMDEDQDDALVYYNEIEKRLFVQITADGQSVTLPFNNEIRAWEPPRNGWFFKGYFERAGTSYGTDRFDDTIYELNSTSDDDGTEIECVMASPLLEFEDGRVTCRWNQMELSGQMTANAEITVETIVNKGSPQQKTFDSTGASFDLAPSLGSVQLGSAALGNGDIGDVMADWDKRFAIYPSLGSDLQIVLSTSGEGQAFAWSSYTVRGKAMSKSAITLT